VSVAPAADRTTEAVLRFAMRVDLPPHTELSEQQFSQLVHEQAARLARFRALLCGEHIPASSVASTDVNPVDLLREKANSDNDHDGDREVEHDVGCDDDDEAAAATATAAAAATATAATAAAAVWLVLEADATKVQAIKVGRTGLR